MGNRAFIQVESERFVEPLVFYGHWSGETNVAAVQSVLERTDRVGDPSYLSAQIFHEFTKLGGYEGGTGFGIWVGRVTAEDWADNPTVVINADTGEMRID